MVAWMPTISQAKEAAEVKTKFMPDVGEHPEDKASHFLDAKLYEEQRKIAREKKQASASSVGEAGPATGSQAASSGQQPSQPSSSTSVVAEIEQDTTIAGEQWKSHPQACLRQ